MNLTFKDGLVAKRDECIASQLQAETIACPRRLGVQLFAEDKASQFFKFYDVSNSGIPRFILLDKQGNILESNAMRPSQKELEEYFNKIE